MAADSLENLSRINDSSDTTAVRAAVFYYVTMAPPIIAATFSRVPGSHDNDSLGLATTTTHDYFLPGRW